MNHKWKIMTVVGARPQFVKASVVSREIAARTELNEIMVHTGQHYDEMMSEVFFRELGIAQPEYTLGIGSMSHGAQVGRMMEALEAITMEVLPQMVVVYGDTNSTMAAALVAAKLHIPLAHIEAGMRSFNKKMPEEINRVVTDHLSDILFVPSYAAEENLHREGLRSRRILNVGDVMYDVALGMMRGVEHYRGTMEKLGMSKGTYVLATIHRAENTESEDRLRAIFEGLVAAAVNQPVVVPMHPRTLKALKHAGLLGVVSEKLRVTEPLGLLDMAQLEMNARLIVTDSGGVQKEAYYCRVPCVTLRDETEWVELVECGWNALVSPSSREGVAAAIMTERSMPPEHPDLYGCGTAAKMIVDEIERVCGGTSRS